MNILFERLNMVKKAAKITNCEDQNYNLEYNTDQADGRRSLFYLPDAGALINVFGDIVFGGAVKKEDGLKLSGLSKAFMESLAEHPILKDIETFAHEIEDLIIPKNTKITVIPHNSDYFSIIVMQQEKDTTVSEEYSIELCRFRIPYVPNDINDFTFEGMIDITIDRFIRLLMADHADYLKVF